MPEKTKVEPSATVTDTTDITEIENISFADSYEEACEDYLDETIPDVSSVSRDADEAVGKKVSPSTAQIKFIRAIERKLNIVADELCFRFKDEASKFIEQHIPLLPPPAIKPPTERQLSFAEGIAEKIGMSLPDDVKTDRRLLSKWIDWNKGIMPPSEAQVSAAKKMAERHFGNESSIPEETMESASMLSEWMDFVKNLKD